VSSERDELEAAATAEVPQFVTATVLFQSAVADQVGVPVGDLHCLNLVLAGIADTPSQLADRMGMTTGAVTKMLDRMEAQRLVVREHDQRDRRRVLVRALPDRQAELAGYYAPMSGFLAERIATLPDRELHFLAEFSRTSREVALRAAVELRAGGRRHGARPRRPAAGSSPE
jgi:DNA-binding MarR family transcriptional regulator